ncbi:DUF192 domain-containing protein [Selenihalanaerobacter shriftii]|uniref:DUF192 domain-containing protein n=1 Tax=Selenihalanaerobacter shriftii TaxID=142842 RepID=A0A1T4KPV7_9FIRM|nr:DUF192 domain-containing protein [Selenihalanaerobacter shriftii]SJZ44444.1 hypothetical protein SAMN02745118_00869 [Selenihalanaerobacter shriftii]
MILINETKGIVIASRIQKADTFSQRLIGLLGKDNLEADEGLLITPCQIIHTFFMKFAIDVIFLNEDNIVVKVISSLPPNRISSFVSSANKVIEFKFTKNLDERVEVGDKIIII